ncbi:unnamed protein product, partial [Polarella glacialis]
VFSALGESPPSELQEEGSCAAEEELQPDRQSSDEESAPEDHMVVFPPSGAWDFPLSRAEKVQRLVELFESRIMELEESEEAPGGSKRSASLGAEGRDVGASDRLGMYARQGQVPVASISLTEPLPATSDAGSGHGSAADARPRVAVTSSGTQATGFSARAWDGPWAPLPLLRSLLPQGRVGGRAQRQDAASRTKHQQQQQQQVSQTAQTSGSGSISAVLWGGGGDGAVRWLRLASKAEAEEAQQSASGDVKVICLPPLRQHKRGFFILCCCCCCLFVIVVVVVVVVVFVVLVVVVAVVIVVLVEMTCSTAHSFHDSCPAPVVASMLMYHSHRSHVP